jgi:hypothetical protein
MSMPFDFSKDKPLTKEDFEPYRMVSLLDLLEFHAYRFISVCELLASLQCHIDDCTENALTEETKDVQKQVKQVWVLGSLARYSKEIIWLKEVLEQIGLTCSTSAADLLSRQIDGDHPNEMDIVELGTAMARLSFAIQAELGNRKAMMIPANRVKFYKDPSTFLGEEVITAFSELGRDAVEAGNCFALGRHTACVFHLMRIAEFMNQKFAKELGITEIQTKKGAIKVEDADWRTIYDHINNHVNGTKTSNPISDKPLREQCNNLLSLTGPLREVRNPLMHSPGDFYTEENAETYIKCIQSFTKQFLKVFQPERTGS